MGIVNISTILPDSPSDTIAYQIVSGPDDMAFFSTGHLVDERPNVTSEAEAPQAAETALIPYGGLPQGAILTFNKTEYIEEIDTTTNQVTARYPVTTNVQYGRYVDNMPVVGAGGFIYIDLGNDGELIYLNKVWRTVTPAGNISIQPVTTAIEKLRHGEVLNPKYIPYNVNIAKIRLGYYEKGRGESQEYLDPAWLFRGTTEQGEPVQYYVYARQFANFTASPTEVTNWGPVQFNDTSETTITNRYWDFGDGTNSTEQNPSHLYKTGGNYSVILTVWNDMGSDTSSRNIGVSYAGVEPVANFTSNYTFVNSISPVTVAFTDTSSGMNLTRYWDFSDGTNSTEQDPVHEFSIPGDMYWESFTVTLTVEDEIGRTSTVTNDIIVTTNQTPDFTAEPRMASRNQTIVFTDTTPWDNWTGGGVNRTYYQSWEFGDGTVESWWNHHNWESTPVSVTHEYPEPGNYTVSLVIDPFCNGECPRKTTKTDYITIFNASESPAADFTANITSGRSPLAVAFADASSGSPLNWNWSFGDGIYSADQNPVHVYSAAGIYTVSLTAANVFGGNTTTRVDYISVSDSTPPVVDFTANVTSGRTPLAVGFTDMSRGSPSHWNWSLGDGTYSTDQNPVHVYPAAGTYTVSLTAANDYGENTSLKVDYISVYEPIPPVADFTANVTSGYEPLVVGFSDTSVNGPEQWNWSFGDGSTSTEKNPEHVYYGSGNFSVSLQVSNEYGNDTEVRTEFITVFRAFPVETIAVPPTLPPLANFSGTPVSGKEHLTVVFNDTSANYPDSWSWDFGDGTNATDEDPVHTYIAAGNYTVSLNATNEAGTNTTVKTDYITVLPLTPPDANFTAEPTSGKAPLLVTFNDTSSGSPTGWLWDFGDGITSAEQDPVHEYTATGNYTVSLTATNDDGSDTEIRPDFITVTSLILPVADFNANTTSGIVPLAVSFTDTSSGSPTSWSWTFGDGGTSVEQNPVYVYTTTGQFTVTLLVTNEDGSNTTTKEQFITGSTLNLPVADFIANTTSGNVPLAVGFTDQSTGSPVTWHWTFGDGTVSDEQNPSHTYTDTGTYTVSLEVTNPDGSNMVTKTDYITVTSTAQPPVASFTGKPTCGKAPLSVKFNDTSTGSPTSWYWVFGDGTNATEQNPVHVYTTAGKYTVSMMVTNAGGSNTSTRIDYIAVSGSVKPPVANFYGKPTSGKAPVSVKFTDTSTGSPTTWYWDFGDGTNATDRNAVHSYTIPGKYTVSLTVTNAGGSNTKTRTEYITVKGTPPPTANFNGKPTSGKTPLSVKFTDTSTGSPTSWFWEFGDGTNDTVQHPVHPYTAAGKYTVSLMASNAGGNTTKTRTQYITVTGSTPTPTHTCTPSQCEPHEVPLVTGSITQDNKVRLDWDVITNPCLQGYKVVISKNNPNPKYPDDGYMFWITDRNTNHAVISSTDHYNGGDFGGYLQPGESYYFSITAVYSDTKVAGNVVELVYPESGTPTTTATTMVTTNPTTTCTQNPCEPYTVPLLNGSINQDGNVRLDWDVIPNSCFQGYKVVISKNNPDPKYPDDGYMFWITNRNTNYSVISSTDHYNGGDFGGYLQPGQAYNFSITAVYPNAKVPGNVIPLTYPAP